MTASTANQSSEQLTRVRRVLRFAVLPILLMAAGLVVLAVVEDSLDERKERLSWRVSVARESIEPLTSIRRDARKAYVALLERWLAPPRSWPDLEKKSETQAGALVRSSQDFVQGTGLTADEGQHRADLATALAAWAAFLERVRGTVAGSEVRGDAHDLLAKIDRECSAILTANLEDASQDNAAREVLHRRSARIHLTVVSLRVLFVAFVVVWYLRMKSTRKLAEALRQKRQQEEQNLALERLVGERTAELSVAKEDLEKRVHELATTKNQLVQAEKLQAVGQLAAGIAHEINTPIQFVGDTCTS